MKISVKKAAPDVYSLKFDETEVALDGAGMKALLLEVTKIMMPGTGLGKSAEDKAKDFLHLIRNANDVGLQTFIMSANHEDMLVLLKCAEGDQMLATKLYGNMSENSKKVFIEDLNYKYKESVPSSLIGPAIDRLKKVMVKLQNEGTVVIENIKKRS